MAEKLERESGWQNYAARFREAAKAGRLGEKYTKSCLDYAEPIYKNGFPIIYDSDHLSRLVGYNSNYLYAAAEDPKYFYRSFTIPKKTSGYRLIREPLPSLKSIQKWLLDNVLNKVETNPSAKAYKKGMSIKDNARFHIRQKFVLTIDIEKFFDNIPAKKIYPVFRSIGYSKSLATLMTKICCYNGHLPQGAPTSAAMSNIIMKPFDNSFWGYCKKRDLRYTRYADDITVSGDLQANQVIGYAKNLIERYGFKINDNKTRNVGKSRRQQVTGIVVNERMQVPREIRRKLRQDLHFIKKFGLTGHALNSSQMKPYFAQSLLGHVNYVLMINKNDEVAQELKSLLQSYINKQRR